MIAEAWNIDVELLCRFENSCSFLNLHLLSIYFHIDHLHYLLLLLSNIHGVKFTHIIAFSAFNAFLLIDRMQLSYFAADCIHRTTTGAEPAADALISKDMVGDEFFTLSGGTTMILDVGFVLLGKILEGRKYRIRGCLPQTA